MNLLRIQALKARTGVSSDTTIYRDVNEGTLTKPVRVSTRCVAWPEHEVDSLLSARAAGATDDQIRALVSKLHTARDAAWKQIQATVGMSEAAA